MIRFVRVVAVGVLGIAVLLCVALLVLRSSVAHTRGELQIAGLAGDVEIVRDRHGIPHIEAESRADAVFALGFVHGQDRLWQMEFQRRLGSGRLAEAVGPNGLTADRFFRTLGIRRVSEAALQHLAPSERATLDAYVAGVNAFLEHRTGLLPPEFLMLGIEPEPWTPTDVVVWQKMMAWDLTGSQMSSETRRAQLIAALGADRASELFPGYREDAPVVLPDFSALYRDISWDALAKAIPPVDPANGSNAWVVSAEHTASARPLLANDPHLGLQAPSLWYFAHLSAPDYEVVGATLPGTPAVLLGRNRHIAWGLTNTGSDVLDLFVERVDPDDPGRYLTPSGFLPFETRREVIAVAGADDVVLDVRETRHGPVISDVVAAAARVADGRHVVAMQWTALDEDDTTIGAALAMNDARNWDAFVDALERWVVPQQTMVYADVDGNIGLIAPARVPIRAGGRGTSPSPGWTEAHDWVDTIPYGALPRRSNPDDGVLVAANHRLVGPEYPYLLTDDWSAPYRAERIHGLLDDDARHTLDTFVAIQRDVTSLHARAMRDLLRDVAPQTQTARAAHETIVAWDGEMTAESPAPLIFSAWYRSLVREIAEDELGEHFDAYWGFRPLFVESVLADRAEWCDDVRTTAVETCVQIAARSLQIAAAELAEAYGADVETWRWGDAHQAEMDHAVMSGIPLLGRLFDLQAANDGGPFTVDVGSFAVRDPYTQDHGPGFRGVYDLADLDESLFMHATGQSGNPLSTRYRDLFPQWIDNRYLPVPTGADSYRSGSSEILTLRAAP